MESSNECNRRGISSTEINFHQSPFVIGACLLKWHNRPIIRRMPCAAQCFSFHCFSRHWPLFFVSPKEFQQFLFVQMKLSYVLFQLFLSFIIFCLLDLIICSKTTLNGWFRKPNAHEKHTGQNKRIVPKCTTALLIPEFFSPSKLQETFTKNTLGKKKG